MVLRDWTEKLKPMVTERAWTKHCLATGGGPFNYLLRVAPSDNLLPQRLNARFVPVNAVRNRKNKSGLSNQVNHR